jgi:hypothetical protein
MSGSGVSASLGGGGGVSSSGVVLRQRKHAPHSPAVGLHHLFHTDSDSFNSGTVFFFFILASNASLCSFIFLNDFLVTCIQNCILFFVILCSSLSLSD